MNRKILRNGVLIASGLLVAYGSPVLARAAGSAQDMGQTQAAPAQKSRRGGPDLNLTDDQKAQMKKIHEDAKSQIAAVNNDASLSADQKQEKIRGIHRDTHKQVETVLTPEQRQQMREWRRAHRNAQPEPEPQGSN